jgi:hypothetical protein
MTELHDMNTFERQVAHEARRLAGPSETVDDAAIFAAIAAAAPTRWGFNPIAGAAKLVVAGAIVSLLSGFLLTSVLDGRLDDGQDFGAVAPASAAIVSPQPRPPSAEDRHTLVIDGITLSIAAAAWPPPGGVPDLIEPDRYPPWWEGVGDLKDGLYMSRDTSGPQDAELMVLWTTFPDGARARPCLLDPSAASADDLAASVATAPGVEVLDPPTGVTIGGRPATRVVVAPKLEASFVGKMVAIPESMAAADADLTAEFVGCLPGFFFAWESGAGGAFWARTQPGDTIRVWAVEVDGKLLVIEAAARANAGAADAEVDAIIDSIRFE